MFVLVFNIGRLSTKLIDRFSLERSPKGGSYKVTWEICFYSNNRIDNNGGVRLRSWRKLIGWNLLSNWEWIINNWVGVFYCSNSVPMHPKVTFLKLFFSFYLF